MNVYFSLVLSALLCGISCDAASKKRSSRTKTEKKSAYVQKIESRDGLEKALESGKPVVLKFYAEWCPACRKFGPVFEKAAKRHGNKALFIAADIDDKNIDALSEEFGVEPLPTIIFFNMNGEKISKQEGAISDSTIDELVEQGMRIEMSTSDETKMSAEQPMIIEEEIIVEEMPALPLIAEEAEKIVETPAPAPQKNDASEKKAHELSTRAEYDELIKNNENVVVKLSATWCGPCKMMEAPFAAIGSKYADKAKFVEVDIDNPAFGELAQEASEGIPTLLFVKNGTVVDKRTGGTSEVTIEHFVKKNMNGSSAAREEKSVKPAKTKLVRGKNN